MPPKVKGLLLSRKSRRKEQRLAKKAKHAQYFMKKKRSTLLPAVLGSNSIATSVGKKKKRSQKQKLNKDDQELNHLERRLGLVKSKKLPSSFKRDGLDYILDFSGTMSEDELEEAASTHKGHCHEKKTHQKVVRFDDIHCELPQTPSTSTDMHYHDLHKSVSVESQKSIPTDLQRRVQGLLNRLSESNMHSISQQMELLYQQNSRNDMNTTFSNTLLKCAVQPILLADKFALELAMLVALLHCHIGNDIGASVTEVLVCKLDSLLSLSPNYGNGKECDCLVLLLTHLYNFKVIHCVLMYDIIRKLVSTLNERDLELLLLILKSCGMEIRQDDSSSLKDIIIEIQEKAASSSTNSSRMQFMLQVLHAIRTNNVRKIPNYDPLLLQHMKKLLRGLARLPQQVLNEENQLKLTLNDLLNCDGQGRWWIVGSVWTGQSKPSSTLTTPTTDDWVMSVARKQQMNTDVRKTIFGVLMTSEDCMDGFEKLIHLQLKSVQEREIVYVVVNCCLQEQCFNPFYAYLSQKLCDYKRSHQVTFQYCVWDYLKRLQTLSIRQSNNFCGLLCHLFVSQSLSLAILRVVEFFELEDSQVNFYQKLLRSVFSNCSEGTCRAICNRVASQTHLKSFSNNLFLFLQHFVPDIKCLSVLEEYLKH